MVEINQYSDELFDDENQVARFNVPNEGTIKKVGSATWIPDKRKYMARVQANKKQRHVGYFDTVEECYIANTAFMHSNDFNKAARIPEAWNKLAQKVNSNVIAGYMK